VDVRFLLPASVHELIESDINIGNSLNGLEGENFKNEVLFNYHLNPDLDPTIISQDEFLSVVVYTTQLYIPINEGLRGFSPQDKEKWAGVVNNADSALYKLQKNPKFKFEGTVIRGDNLSDELIENLFPVGGIHQDNGFKSSSSNLDKPFSGNTEIRIRSKNGVNLENISVAPQEEEVLFRPKTKFKVLKRDKINGINFIELEEI